MKTIISYALLQHPIRFSFLNSSKPQGLAIQPVRKQLINA